MIKKKFLFLLFFGTSLLAQTNIDLVGSLNQYPSVGYNDIWGYVDPMGNEYALLGVRSGTSIVDLSDPANPLEVSFIPGPQSVVRDIKVHEQYAYTITEQTGSGQGLQIIDLSDLPNSATLVNTIDTWFTRAHNIFIADGYAYVIGGNGGGGMHILDLSNPVNPTETAYYTASGYIHDVFVWDDTVVVCNGSSGEYHLVDVSDKTNPQLISVSPSIPGYAHSGWMTEDKRYFIGTEEGNQVDITVWDLQDRTSWDLVVPSWETNSGAIVHNLFIMGNYAHISYYKDGYVVLDISDPTAPILAGQYDTFPGSGGTYDGAWGCYPYLPSGHVIISDMSTGLYVVDFLGDNTTSTNDISSQPVEFELKQNYPNPFNPSTQIRYSIANSEFVNLSIFNSLGEIVAELVNETKSAGEYTVTFDAGNFASGVYIARITAGNFTQIIKMSLLK